MNVATIQMEPAAAKAKLKEYRGRKRRAVDAEYARAEQAYAELAKGTPLIVLSDAINGAPRDAKDRPRIAIARADRTQVRLEWDTRQRCIFNAADESVTHVARRHWPELAIAVGLERELDRVKAPTAWGARGFALVPIVPPGVRAARALNTHFVLWEVETWADERIGATPDRDPYLLRRVADDLFAVVGEWELTDIERAIMRDRRG